MTVTEKLLRTCAGLALGILAGCSTTPTDLDNPAQSARRARAALSLGALPTSCQRMVDLARQEWALFGKLELNEVSDHPLRRAGRHAESAKHELDPPMLSRVLVYWSGLGPSPTVSANGALRPWSGAFISWLARNAGHGPRAFPVTALHWDYIERALAPEAGSAFVAREVKEHAPQVGDLVCSTRDPALEAAGRPLGMLPLKALRRSTYHCDLVVETRPGEIHVIGGNVSDTVALTRIASDAEGRLRADRRRIWATILTPRTPSGESDTGLNRIASSCPPRKSS